MSVSFTWSPKRAIRPLRLAVRQLVPPLFVSALKHAREKRYASFEEAQRHSPAVYDSEHLTRFRVEKAKLNMQGVRSERLSGGYSLLLAAAALREAPELDVCDFGGACGEWGYALQLDVPHRRCRVTVVENESLARACASDPFFDWATWVNSVPAAFDVFLCSGALPYVSDPYAVLAQAFQRARHAVVITRTAMAERESFRVSATRLKNNGFGEVIPKGFNGEEWVYYPERTISMPRVTELAKEHGFQLKLQLTGSAPRSASDSVERDLLFVKGAPLA